MELKGLFTDDDAVSPVIGVILMVAITVILAAVIASFVLGLGNSAQDQTPTASFGFDYDGDGNGQGNLSVSHGGGDPIEAQNLYVRGTGFDDTYKDSTDLHDAGSWDEADGDENSYSSVEEITSGKRIVVGVSSDYAIDVVYESQDQEESSTLTSDSGPDA